MSDRKNRIEISHETAAFILFKSDRTCCVCRHRGKPIQIHHIDENPANNDPENLAVVCFDCHNATQVKGGFGRKLDAVQVRKYREDWLQRVESRRNAADHIAAAHQSAPAPARPAQRRDGLPDPKRVANYIRTLPAIRRDIYDRSKELWDSGVTPKMKQGNNDVIDVLEQILATLVSFYPAGHFDNQEPHDYINAITASRYMWHWSRLEPNGPRTRGTIVGPIAGGCVIDDLEHMVLELVSELSECLDDFEYDHWKKEWDVVETSATSRMRS
jgi:hypothetical protein